MRSGTRDERLGGVWKDHRVRCTRTSGEGGPQPRYRRRRLLRLRGQDGDAVGRELHVRVDRKYRDTAAAPIRYDEAPHVGRNACEARLLARPGHRDLAAGVKVDYADRVRTAVRHIGAMPGGVYVDQVGKL